MKSCIINEVAVIAANCDGYLPLYFLLGRILAFKYCQPKNRLVIDAPTALLSDKESKSNLCNMITVLHNIHYAPVYHTSEVFLTGEFVPCVALFYSNTDSILILARTNEDQDNESYNIEGEVNDEQILIDSIVQPRLLETIDSHFHQAVTQAQEEFTLKFQKASSTRLCVSYPKASAQYENARVRWCC